MKRPSNDDILNCAGPINRPKVTLISGVVRDDCFLEKVARSHQCIRFLYNTRLVLKAEVEPPWTAEHFLWWKAVYNYILCVTVCGWLLNCQFLQWYYDLRRLKMKNVFAWIYIQFKKSVEIKLVYTMSNTILVFKNLGPNTRVKTQIKRKKKFSNEYFGHFKVKLDNLSFINTWR